MKITAVDYGESTLPEKMIFRGGDPAKALPITFTVYLLQDGDRSILVDAGCETMPGFDMKEFCGPVKALERLGVAPEDITDLIITHAHHDHIECAKYYKNAIVYIQKNELTKSKNHLDKSKEIISFDTEISVTENVKAIKIGGHSKGSSIVEIYGFEKIYVISGDECYLRRCIDERIPTGSSVSPEQSKAFIQKYSDEKYKILYCHDSMNN